MIKRRKWDNWLSQNYNCIEISTCLPAFIYINVNLTRITGVLGIADIAGKRTYTNTMLDWTGDNLVPGVLSPYDVGKLSLPRVLSSDWSISISVAWTVCHGAEIRQCWGHLNEALKFSHNFPPLMLFDKTITNLNFWETPSQCLRNLRAKPMTNRPPL